jgi:hypothetical protein
MFVSDIVYGAKRKNHPSNSMYVLAFLSQYKITKQRRQKHYVCAAVK